jgi:L-fuculose-phosphate aldolase
LSIAADLLRERVLTMCHKMVEHGLVVAKQGNVSAKLPSDGGVLITPSELPYEEMVPADLLVLDISGKVVQGQLKPSKETPMHLAIYRARRDVCAVVHTHSPYATVVSARHESIPPFLEEQIPYLGGEIRTAGYAMSGTEELGANVVAALGNRNAALLANHGAVACGTDLEQAFRNAQLVERIAQVYVFSRSLGNVFALPEYSIRVQTEGYESKRRLLFPDEGKE